MPCRNISFQSMELNLDRPKYFNDKYIIIMVTCPLFVKLESLAPMGAAGWPHKLKKKHYLENITRVNWNAGVWKGLKETQNRRFYCDFPLSGKEH